MTLTTAKLMGPKAPARKQIAPETQALLDELGELTEFDQKYGLGAPGKKRQAAIEAELLQIEENKIAEAESVASELQDVEPEYRQALEETIEIVRTYCDARERLTVLRARHVAVRRRARALGQAVEPDDSFADRIVKLNEYRHLQERIAVTTGGPW